MWFLCDESTSRSPFPLAESGCDSANGKEGVSIGRSQEAAFTMSDEPANANPPFHWRNQGLIPPMERGGFPLAGRKKQHLPCPISLPIEPSPFPLAESASDSANGKGEVSIGRSQEAAFTMSDEAAN